MHPRGANPSFGKLNPIRQCNTQFTDMSTPFTDNPRIALLRSLEDECASRYAENTRRVVELLEECRILREQRDRARNALRKLLQAYEDDCNNAPEWPIRRSWETNRDPVNEAKEALR